MRLPVPPLLIISDRHQARQPLEQLAEAVLAGGCRWFSLREKDLPPAERRALLGALVVLGRRCGAMVSVHDDIDAVIVAGAGAVHLPSGSNPAAVRSRLPRALIGASAHCAERSLRPAESRRRLRDRQPGLCYRKQTRLRSGARSRRSRKRCGAGAGPGYRPRRRHGGERCSCAALPVRTASP